MTLYNVEKTKTEIKRESKSKITDRQTEISVSIKEPPGRRTACLTLPESHIQLFSLFKQFRKNWSQTEPEL